MHHHHIRKQELKKTDSESSSSTILTRHIDKISSNISSSYTEVRMKK